MIQILISRLIKFCDESYVAPDCTLYGIRFDAIWYQIVSAVSHQIANFFILGQVTLIRYKMCVHDPVSSCQTYIINLCRVVYQRICGLSKVTSLTLETLNVKFISNYFYGRSRQCSAENHQRDFLHRNGILKSTLRYNMSIVGSIQLQVTASF